MPEKDRADLIREHGERIATLGERIDQLRRDVDRARDLQESARQIHAETTEKIATLVKDVERLNKMLDETLSRRWDLWKLVLGAFLGASLAVGAGLLSRSLERIFR